MKYLIIFGFILLTFYSCSIKTRAYKIILIDSFRLDKKFTHSELESMRKVIDLLKVIASRHGRIRSEVIYDSNFNKVFVLSTRKGHRKIRKFIKTLNCETGLCKSLSDTKFKNKKLSETLQTSQDLVKTLETKHTKDSILLEKLKIELKISRDSLKSK